MFGTLLLLFTIVPALEFYLLFTVGSEIGAGTTFLIIVSTGVIGAFLAKMEGLSILGKIQEEFRHGKMPANSLVHGFIIFGGGLLLLTPGFITDILGFCMVIPGTRHMIVLFAVKYFESAVASGNIHVFTNAQGSPSGFENAKDNENVIEAEYEKK